jgi:hypothetical protein
MVSFEQALVLLRMCLNLTSVTMGAFKREQTFESDYDDNIVISPTARFPFPVKFAHRRLYSKLGFLVHQQPGTKVVIAGDYRTIKIWLRRCDLQF